MKILLSIFFVLLFSISLFAQNEFNFTDTIFHIGQKKTIHLQRDYDGPCTSSPCYELGNNKIIYDSIVVFLNKNTTMCVAFIWHNDVRGSAEMNFVISKKMASGLITILTQRLGIKESRVSAIGMGEAFPIMTLDEIDKLKTDEEKYIAYRQNERIEMIILCK